MVFCIHLHINIKIEQKKLICKQFAYEPTNIPTSRLPPRKLE